VLSELLAVPAALVMQVHPRAIEVYSKSSNRSNPYTEGETARLNTGLYCETVMATRSELLVPNALEDPTWDHNPDIELGMIAYLGLPLEWPNGDIFGTICVLDNKTNEHSPMHRRVLAQFRTLVEQDIAWIVETEALRAKQERLANEAKEAATAMLGLEKLAKYHERDREMDRAALAEELHNEVVQSLTGVKIDLDMCSQKLPPSILEGVQPSLESIVEAIDNTIRLVRDMCTRLVPPMLTDLGLPATIEHEIEAYDCEGQRFTLNVEDPLSDLNPWMQLMLFRLVQQGLEHIAGVEGVNHVSIGLGRRDKNAVLRLTIDGYSLVPPGNRLRDREMFDEARVHARTWGGYFGGWKNEQGQAVIEMALPISPQGIV